MTKQKIEADRVEANLSEEDAPPDDSRKPVLRAPTRQEMHYGNNGQATSSAEWIRQLQRNAD